MDQRFGHLLDQLMDYAPTRDRELFIESRGIQVIASAQHLVRLIRESYDAPRASDLTRRLLRAIDSGDEEKFRRPLRVMRERRTAPRPTSSPAAGPAVAATKGKSA